MNRPKILFVLAHPDDESLGAGGVIARYVAEGAEVSLLVATRGERGWQGDADAHPGAAALAALRSAELAAAAAVLGLHEVSFLGYRDGELADADPVEAAIRIGRHVRRLRPDVVVSFGPDGVYGHPDHVAISQLTTAALLRAAAPSAADDGDAAPHSVAKLYYLVYTHVQAARYLAIFGGGRKRVANVPRLMVGWEEWAVTTRIDTGDHWRTVWAAIACHRSQLPDLDRLTALPEAQRREVCAEQTFYRAFSLVNGGAAVEDDLLAGLRVPEAPVAPHELSRPLVRRLEAVATAFAQRHPAWAEALFDLALWRGRGAAAVAARDPGGLARAWTAQFRYRDPALVERDVARLTPVAEDLFALLDADPATIVSVRRRDEGRRLAALRWWTRRSRGAHGLT